MTENIEQQQKDSNMVFNQISIAFDNYREAELAIVPLYIMDMSISRSGISHALTRLKRYYEETEKD